MSAAENGLAVEMLGVTKQFPGVLANDHVDFSVRAGEIHALVGENGAGKSTLMNLLYGLIHMDSGQILIDRKATRITGTRDAIARGIGTFDFLRGEEPYKHGFGPVPEDLFNVRIAP